MEISAEGHGADLAKERRLLPVPVRGAGATMVFLRGPLRCGAVEVGADLRSHIRGADDPISYVSSARYEIINMSVNERVY